MKQIRRQQACGLAFVKSKIINEKEKLKEGLSKLIKTIKGMFSGLMIPKFKKMQKDMLIQIPYI